MVQFLKSKQVTYKNRPVGVVSVNTGAVEAELQTAKLFERGQALAWEEAKQDAIQSDINKAKTEAVNISDEKEKSANKK